MSLQAQVGAVVAASAVLVSTAIGWAAVPPRSVENLTETAAVIVQGQVLSVTSTVADTESHGTNRVFTAEVAVHCLEKGEAIATGTTIVVHSWVPESRPDGWVGHQGGPVPTAEQYVRAYLTVEDGTYHLIPPNGLTTLEPTASADGTVTLVCPPSP